MVPLKGKKKWHFISYGNEKATPYCTSNMGDSHLRPGHIWQVTTRQASNCLMSWMPLDALLSGHYSTMTVRLGHQNIFP